MRPPRVPFTRALGVKPEGASPARLLATNLSRGGLFVTTGEPPSCGTRVSLELAAAGRFLDFAEGEVVWVRPRKGFGLRFTRLKPNAQALVEHLVARGGTGDLKRPRAFVWALVAALAAGASIAFFQTRPKPIVPPPPPALVAIEPVSAQPHRGEFQFALPTGGVTSLRVTINDDEIAVAPTLRRGVTLRNVFDLVKPARLVIDVAGREPKYSWQLEGSTVVKSVRVGARNHGTRVVIDLPELPKRYRVIKPNSPAI